MLSVKTSYKLKTKGLDKLKANLQKLNKNGVDLGILDQGQHYSGMSYATLLALHHEGYITEEGVNVPSRPVLIHTASMMQGTGYKREVEKLLRMAMTNFNSASMVKTFLGKYGELVKDVTQNDVMGNPVRLHPVTDFTLENRIENGDQTPLVDTGDLRDKIDYRINR